MIGALINTFRLNDATMTFRVERSCSFVFRRRLGLNYAESGSGEAARVFFFHMFKCDMRERDKMRDRVWKLLIKLIMTKEYMHLVYK